MTRPSEIVRWQDIEQDPWSYPGRTEKMGRDADYSTHFGFDLFGVHHVRLEPGRRTSLPHAESNEDEFIFVLEGTPDVWIDGHLHALSPGDGVGFKAGTGVSHTFLNNSAEEVRLLVVGDRKRPGSRILYPLDPDRKPLRSDWWEDAPERVLGPHDGLPAPRR